MPQGCTWTVTWKWFFFWHTKASSAFEKLNPLSASTRKCGRGLQNNSQWTFLEKKFLHFFQVFIVERVPGLFQELLELDTLVRAVQVHGSSSVLTRVRVIKSEVILAGWPHGLDARRFRWRNSGSVPATPPSVVQAGQWFLLDVDDRRGTTLRWSRLRLTIVRVVFPFLLTRNGTRNGNLDLDIVTSVHVGCLGWESWCAGMSTVSEGT